MGRIVEKHSGERIQLPVKTETAVVMQSDWRFESTMSEVRARLQNDMLVCMYALSADY